ncbi:MAG: LacI family DNA-binding transcriptional regulator [Anaerolineae bacterium]|jgi:LacI family transcriptional regulator|nr:LacI family DNA-binding transcriptional regulator [Anaerolineae bacterium]
MSSQKTTIVDVAAKAGVSFGTVSRVINNDVHVRPATRERVLQAMEQLGFVANRQARSLAGGKTGAIGLLVPDLGTSYIGEIIRGIDAELTLQELDLILYTTHRTASKEANYVANLAQGMVDGLLLVLPRNPADYVGTLTQRNFPFVLIDHQGTGKECPAVGATNWQGAFDATEHLLKLGHRRIGFITGSMDLGCAQDRLAGYRAALRTHHIPYTDELIYEGTFFQPDGFTGALALLDVPDPPTAIFASNDVMAMGAMDAIRQRSLRVPDDIAVLGFDDIPQAALVRPALTTIQQPLEKMGRVATQMLLDLLEAPESKIQRIELPTKLIIRDSCCSRQGTHSDVFNTANST